MHHEAVEHLLEGLDHGVELARAEPHAAAVQRRVRAPGDQAAPARSEGDPVAVAPDARIVLEVGGAVAAAIGVVPETDRHRRHRRADHELAELADHRVPGRIEGGDIDRERGAGDLAAEDRLQRPALDDPGADVGAAAADVQQHLRAELLIDPVVAFRCERRARRAELADRAQVALAQADPGLAAGHQQRRAHPHLRRAQLLRQAPLHLEVGVQRVAVEHHDRGSQQQRGDQRVPHHPRRRREPQEAVAGAQIPAQPAVLEMLDEDSAVTVNDRLRQPGRARGEQHAQRMIEGHLLELERRRRARQERVPADARGQLVIGPAGVGNRDELLERRQRRAQRRHLGAAVDRALAVAVAGDREHDLRLEHRETVDHAARAELGRARSPDRAEARRREEGDQRLRNVRQVADDAVAGPDTERPQAGPGRRDLLAQVAEGQLERAAGLRARDHGHGVLVALLAEHVLGVVQPRPGEPLGARHPLRTEHPLVRRRGAHAEELPERAPEALEVADRPAVQLVVAVKGAIVALREPGQVAADLAPLVRGRRRAPENLAESAYTSSSIRDCFAVSAGFTMCRMNGRLTRLV